MENKLEDQSEAKQRARASTVVCSIVIISFIAIGFVTLFSKIILNISVDPPGEWLAAMLSLASTALGFLAGDKNKEKPMCQCQPNVTNCTKISKNG